MLQRFSLYQHCVHFSSKTRNDNRISRLNCWRMGRSRYSSRSVWEVEGKTLKKPGAFRDSWFTFDLARSVGAAAKDDYRV